MQRWPTYDPTALIPDTVTLPIQVDGKVRGTIEVEQTADEQTVIERVLAEKSVRNALDGLQPRRVVYVPGRVVNLVR